MASASSYTSFKRELLDVTHEGEDLLAKVRVTNEGQVAGRDVAQLYATAPVRQGVEKSAAVLVAFAKTDELAPARRPSWSCAAASATLPAGTCLPAAGCLTREATPSA